MSLGLFVAFAVAALLLAVVVGYVDHELHAQRAHQCELIALVNRVVAQVDGGDARPHCPRAAVRPAPAPRRIKTRWRDAGGTP